MADIAERAKELVYGSRRERYGDPKDSYVNISSAWSLILGTDVTPSQVVQCMVALKMVREAYRHDRDNLVDMIGYLMIDDDLRGEAEDAEVKF